LRKIRDYDEAATEHFGKRKDRKKPKGRQSVAALQAAATTNSAQAFADPGLQALFERGYLTRVLSEVKSGKEATVYLAEGESGFLAAKLYRDARVRSFKNDQTYRQGRFVGDARIKKAMDQRTKTGLSAQQALWVYHEYRELWTLHRAGLPVPTPRVGPDPEAIGMAGRVVLMDYVGDEDGPAPRLSDLRLPPDAAQAAWEQSVDILSRLLALGRVHGDYSAYNLLWWQEQVVVIDFPQIVNVAENPNWRALLARDAASLCTSFRRHGLVMDPDEVLRDVLKRQA
jgi:RIO kinase 1